MLYIDTETFNAEKDISAGTYEYARTAETLLVTYAVGDAPVQLWDATLDPLIPDDLDDALHDQRMPITAHNAMFDRNVLRETLLPFNSVYVERDRWRCTMVKALSHGFPGGLDQLGRILGLPQEQAKLKTGKKLINRFCKPAPKNHKVNRYDHHTHPEEWAQFCEYAIQDVEAMREIDRRLPDWNYRGFELDIYHLDQTINDRGFLVDRELVEAGSAAAIAEKEALARRFVELTGGAVARPTQREQFRQYLNNTFRTHFEDTKSQTFKDFLATTAFAKPELQELLEISIMSNKTSTAKYGSLEPAISPDGRFRGGLQCAGAARTRRWAGRTFQPHNLPSRGLPPQNSIEQYISALKEGVHDMLFDDLMLYGSAALRGVLVAPKGKKLVVSDLSNIEGRANAWLAGETWKLEAFAEYDKGIGHDLYRVAAGRILGKKPENIDGTERNGIGKVSELALGYQGGVGALQNFAKGQMAALMPIIVDAAPDELIGAEENYEIWGKEHSPDMDREEWLASEAIKLAWRGRHPKIVNLWRACEEAALAAIAHPGNAYRAGEHLVFKALAYRGHRYLLVRMPSGNFLVYFDPRVFDKKITYMGLNSITRQWTRIDTYGGKFVENICQSLSRDILAHNMPACEADGFEILLTVHDETVTEAPDRPEFNADRLSNHLATLPPWAAGFPLAAAGFEANRYQKG